MTTTKTKIRPLKDRVLVKRIESEEKKFGGIILPDTAQKKQDMGVVVSVGPGKEDKDGKRVPLHVKEGETILWDKYAGNEISLEEEEFVIVKADDIIAVIEE
ncbi:MAG: co-chaperone GroES [Chlamydiae bacterium RIFCSPHIGHO2_12_FULL_49_11]|nr:MAG: co-chaperone GroES [Chlamydiae bacterium RIFCSPHIGHO2_12_FULL_49_11]